MKIRKLEYLLYFSTSILLTTSGVWAAEYVCPREIGTQQKLSAPVGDWHVFRDKINERYLLERIALYDGPPEEHADLVPDNEDAVPDAGEEWTFNPMTPATNRRIWLVCMYQDTSVKLSRELPASTRKCKVVYAKEPGRQIQSLQCED